MEEIEKKVFEPADNLWFCFIIKGTKIPDWCNENYYTVMRVM